MTDDARPPWRRKRGGEGPTSKFTPLNAPQPIEVETNARGIPRRVVRNGQRRMVMEIQDVWRVDDLWWRVPVNRRYYLLVLDDDDLWSI